MSFKSVFCLAAALPLAACATTPQLADSGEAVPESALIPYEQWPTEFAGNTVLIETEEGYVNAVNLDPGGTMTIIPEMSDKAIKGTWGTKGEGLCTNFAPRGEECWPYKSILAANGGWVKVQSTRGKILNVRLMSEDEEDLVERAG